MDAHFTEKSTHLMVTCSGEWSLDDVRKVLHWIADKAASSSKTRILVNLLDVSAPTTDSERYRAGEDVARIIRRPLKLAVVYHRELINKLAENTAVNRGADFLVCGDEAEALAWLLNDQAANRI